MTREQQTILPNRLTLADLPHLIYEAGDGLVVNGEVVRLALQANSGTTYADAQLDDYHLDGTLRWNPPLRLRIHARFSHPEGQLRGTAGFGFWNDPFGMTASDHGWAWWRRIKLPQAAWFFFASPPSNMALASDLPGSGWKAATIDASGLAAKMLLPLAPFGMLACRVPLLYQRLWPMAQRVLKIDERILPFSMDEWREYELVWERNRTVFRIDGAEVFRTRFAPVGPLGFVAWIDNQYMVATPQGRIRSGIIATNEQLLEISALDVESVS